MTNEPIQTNQPATAAKTPSSKKRMAQPIAGLNLNRVTFILSCLLLILLLYLLLDRAHFEKKMHSNWQDITKEMADLKIQAHHNQESLTEALQSVASLRKDTEHAIHQTQSTLTNYAQQSESTKNNWILLKARFCLELAQMNNHWTHDRDTTIALLTAAQQWLGGLKNKEIFAIRQEIATEITHLQAQPMLDKPKLLSELDALQQLVRSISLVQTKPTEATALSHPTEQPVWKSHFKKTLTVLEKLIVIRHRDETMPALPTPEYEQLAREQIIFALQAAQWGLLKTEENSYQLALKQAETNIKQLFPQENQQVQSLLQAIHKLQSIQLHGEESNIDPALAMLTTLIDKNSSTQSLIPDGEAA